MIAHFNSFSIEMTEEQALSVSHSGDCESDILRLMCQPSIRRQLNNISNTELVTNLESHGAWETPEMVTRGDNEIRIIWLAACNIRKEMNEKESNDLKNKPLLKVQQSMLSRCLNFIIDITHYRGDGSCKCNDPNEKIMRKWGYKWSKKYNQWK